MLRSLGLVPLFVFIALTEALSIIQIYEVPATSEPPFVAPILNTVFIFLVSLTVAYMSARSFLQCGSLVILILGSGALALGLAGLFSGWLISVPNGPNKAVTIHDIGALVSSVFFAASAILSLAGVTLQRSRYGRLRVVFYYVGVMAFMALVITACLLGCTPPFFIQGAGPTLMGHVVLGTAVSLFAFSAISFMLIHTKFKSDVIYWYSMGLVLFATGFFGVFLQKAVGSPLSWVGRFAQYFGGVYLLIAVLATFRRVVAKAFEVKPRATSRLAGALAVLVLIGTLIVAAVLDLTEVFEPPFLVPTLNVIFIASTSLVVAYFSAKSFIASGLHAILFMSCATLVYGLGSLTGAWLFIFQGGTNTFFTVQNSAALLSSGFHITGAGLTARKAPSRSSEHKRLKVLFGYIGMLLVIIFLVIVSLRGIAPSFYVVGVGSTSLRIWVLGIAVSLFFLSSLFLVRLYFRSKSTLLYWYSLGLMLIAVALASLYLQHAVGDLLGWIGRIAQYLAGIYFAIAVLTTFRASSTNRKGIDNNDVQSASRVFHE